MECDAGWLTCIRYNYYYYYLYFVFFSFALNGSLCVLSAVLYMHLCATKTTYIFVGYPIVVHSGHMQFLFDRQFCFLFVSVFLWQSWPLLLRLPIRFVVSRVNECGMKWENNGIGWLIGLTFCNNNKNNDNHEYKINIIKMSNQTFAIKIFSHFSHCLFNFIVDSSIKKSYIWFLFLSLFTKIQSFTTDWVEWQTKKLFSVFRSCCDSANAVDFCLIGSGMSRRRGEKKNSSGW